MSKPTILLSTPLLAAALVAAAACRKPNVPPPLTFSCANQPVVAPDLPGDVDLPRHPEVQCFAWQQFIALNWPVLDGRAGEPDRARTGASFGRPGDPTPTVWETYKEAHEVFLPDGSRPRPWGEAAPLVGLPRHFDLAATRRALPEVSRAQDDGIQMLLMTSKVSPSAARLVRGSQADGGRLVSQEGKLTYYGIHLNGVEFDYILDNGFYDAREQAGADVILPAGRSGRGSAPAAEGAIEVKSAWVELTRTADRRRYRTIRACIVAGDGCRMATVGLVGLHIAHKTETFPQWSWATFEHVDNAPDREQVRQGRLARRYRYHDPRCSTCPVNRRHSPSDPPDRPVQVVRETPIAASTALLNRQMQQAIRRANPKSVWQYYQLVEVQWPEAAEPSGPDRFAPLPQGGATPTSAANTTLETFVQHVTCIDCHRGATIACSSLDRAPRRAADYSFLFGMAREPEVPPECR